jgi:hypothetical protein
MSNAFLDMFNFASNACGTSTGFLPSLYDPPLKCVGGQPEIQSLADIAIIIGNIVRILIAISGSLAIILLMIASIYYITAMGNPSQVKKAKEIIINTCIGLVLIVMSYAIVTYIAGNF